jgi:hypothetical protein
MAVKRNLQVKWRSVLRVPGVYISLVMIWLAGLFFHSFSGPVPFVAPLLIVSTVILALGRASFEALVKSAMVFWLYFTILTLYLTLFGLANPGNPAGLAVKLALGLHPILLWTPMELGRAFQGLVRIFIGDRRAGHLALCLVVILKLLPGLMIETQKLKRTIGLRGEHLPFFQKLTLLTRNLLRLESQRTDELVRALMAR